MNNTNELFISDTLNQVPVSFFTSYFKVYPANLDDIKDIISSGGVFKSLLTTQEAVDKLSTLLNIELKINTEEKTEMKKGDKVVIYRNIDGKDRFLLMIVTAL